MSSYYGNSQSGSMYSSGRDFNKVSICLVVPQSDLSLQLFRTCVSVVNRLMYRMRSSSILYQSRVDCAVGCASDCLWVVFVHPTLEIG